MKRYVKYSGYDIQPRTPGPTDMDNIMTVKRGVQDLICKIITLLRPKNIYFQSYDNFEEILQVQARQLQVSPKRLHLTMLETFRKHAEELYTKYPEFYYVWQDS